MGLNFSGGANCRNLSGYAPAYTNADDFTISLWVKFNSFPGAGVEANVFGGFNSGVAPLVTIQLSLLSTVFGTDKRPGFLIWANGAANYDSVGWGSDLSTGVWYHIVCRYSTTTNELYININNGTPVTAANTNSDGRAFTLTGNAIAFGARHGNGGAGNFDTPANVCISEIYIWRSSLTADQIKTLYSGVRRIGLGINPTSLEFYQPYDDQPNGSNADGDTTVDLKNTANNGTINDGSGTITWDYTEPLVYPPGAIVVDAYATESSQSATATPSLVNISVLTKSVTTSIIYNASVSVSLCVVSVIVNTSTASTSTGGSQSSTATPSISITKISINSVSTLISNSSIANPSSALISISINQPNLISSNGSIAMPAVSRISAIVNTPTTSFFRSSISSPSVANVFFVSSSPTIFTQRIVSVNSSISSINIIINSPSVSISTGASGIIRKSLKRSRISKFVYEDSELDKFVTLKSSMKD